MTSLPTSWQFVPLESLVREAQSGFASGQRDINGTIQVRMNNVTTEGNWDWSKVLRVPASEKQRTKYRLEAGDVLVNTTNSPNLVGKTGYFSGSHETLVFSNHFVRLRLKHDRIDPDYLRRWLNVLWTRRVFEGLCTQWVNQASVRREDLLALQIPLPPLEEQRRIAAILDKADAVRRKRQQAITLTEELLRSAFLEMFGDPVTNPKGWRLHKLVDLTSKIGSGSTPRGGEANYKSEGIPLIRSMNVYDYSFDYGGLAYIDEGQAKALNHVTVTKNDILLNITGASVARCTIVPSSLTPARVNQHVAIIRTKPHLLEPSYLLNLVNSASFKKKLLSIGRSKGATREALTKDELQNLSIPVPPIHLQEQFASITDRLMSCGKQHLEMGQESDNLFNSLIQRTFRGEL